jgi:hypothetical protein
VGRIFVDIEFTHLPWTGRSTLFWVGICDDSGVIYSAVNSDVDLGDTSDFVRERVLPMIPADEPRLDTAALAAGVRGFCREADVFWAWQPSKADIAGFGRTDAAVLHHRYTDWDLQLLRTLTGESAPPWDRCHDLHHLADTTGVTLPANPHAHHPGHDAEWGRQVFRTANHYGEELP